MTTNRTDAVQPMSGAYRAVWRWHFYAGLIVLPVLMLMAWLEARTAAAQQSRPRVAAR